MQESAPSHTSRFDKLFTEAFRKPRSDISNVALIGVVSSIQSELAGLDERPILRSRTLEREKLELPYDAARASRRAIQRARKEGPQYRKETVDKLFELEKQALDHMSTWTVDLAAAASNPALLRAAVRNSTYTALASNTTPASVQTLIFTLAGTETIAKMSGPGTFDETRAGLANFHKKAAAETAWDIVNEWNTTQPARNVFLENLLYENAGHPDRRHQPFSAKQVQAYVAITIPPVGHTWDDILTSVKQTRLATGTPEAPLSWKRPSLQESLVL